MSIYTLKQRNTLILVVTILLGLFIGYALLDIFTAILGAVIIYTLFRPMYGKLVEDHNFNKPLSAILIMVLSFIFLLLPFFVLSWLIIDKIVYFNAHPEEVTIIVDQIAEFAGTQLNMPGLIERLLDKIESWALGTFSSVINGSLKIFLLVSVLYFLLYFMLVNYKKFEDTIPKYVPFSEANREKFSEELKKITYSNVLGQGIIAFIQASLIVIGFLIFGIPNPLFWGVIAFFLAFIPFIGTPFVFVPVAILTYIGGNTFGGIGMIIYGFVFVTNIDNILRFMINKKVANTHPVVTILGVIIGIPFFGILGLVVGPLLLSYFILLVKLFESEYAKQSQTDPNS